MLYFQACPRCDTGTVELRRDDYGYYLLCLNCGHSKDLERNASIEEALAK